MSYARHAALAIAMLAGALILVAVLVMVFEERDDEHRQQFDRAMVGN